MAEHGTDHGHDHGHAHVPGQMDITEQKRTFGGFVLGGVYLVIGVIIILLFMALVNS